MVQNHANCVGLGRALIEQPSHPVGEVLHGASFRGLDLPPAGLPLAMEEKSVGVFAFIGIVLGRAILVMLRVKRVTERPCFSKK
jgi:hypothetical protein